MKPLLHSLLLMVFLSSCEVKLKKTTTDNEPANTAATTKSDADILHNISLEESGGLKVGQAFLTFEDGRLLPKTHRVNLGETVILHLVIDGGWKIRDGKASIDASEIITTNEGQIVLNARNLFQQSPTLAAEDAKRVVLKAVITKTSKEIDHFIVNYRLWDQWGDAEVKGSYKLYVNTETN